MRQHKIIVFSLVLIVGLLLAIAPAAASPVTVQFVGLGGESQNGVYTYPYYLTIDHGPWTPMMCDDFYDRIGVGDSWQANITQLSSGDMSLTRFGDLTEYEEAAYLLLQTNDTTPRSGAISIGRSGRSSIPAPIPVLSTRRGWTIG